MEENKKVSPPPSADMGKALEDYEKRGKIKRVGVPLGKVLETPSPPLPERPPKVPLPPWKSTPEEQPPTEPVRPTREPPQRPKRNVLTEVLKIAGEGLGNYAGQRAGEEEAFNERTEAYNKEAEYDKKAEAYSKDREAYNKKLKELSMTRYQKLRAKINDGTATPEEVKEYRARQKELGAGKDEYSDL